MKTAQEIERDELVRRAVFQITMRRGSAALVARIWHLLRPDERQLLYEAYGLHVFPWPQVTA